MTPSWYDVLGVEPDADTTEIRAAWKTQVADLDPTDRRFRLLNKAAEVLLDDERRRAHDAELAEQGLDEDLDGSPVETPDDASHEGSAGDPRNDTVTAQVVTKQDPESSEAPAGRSLVVTVSLGVVAVIAVIAAVLTLTLGGAGDLDGNGADGLPDAREVAAARAAAEAAVVPVLSYDYRALEQGKQAALSYMTPDYAEEYEQLFASVIAVNAPSTETVVSVDVKTSGIVRTGPGLVDVLLFVDRPTTNKQQTTPEIYKDHATLRMRDVGGEWLVDCILSGAGSTCE